MQFAIEDLQELEEIIFFLNGDEARRKATEKYSKELQELKPTIQITQVEVPKNEDVNSLGQSHEAEIFTHLLDNRKPFFPSNEEKEEPEQAEPEVKENLAFATLRTENPDGASVSLVSIIEQRPALECEITGRVNRRR